MKKTTCLILTIIGVLLLIAGLVVVVPWLVNIVQEFSEMQEKARRIRDFYQTRR